MDILMISPFCPYPSNDGGKVRIVELFNGLSRFHNVILVFPKIEGENCSDENLLINKKNIFVPVSGKKKFEKYLFVVTKKPYHYHLWFYKEMEQYISHYLENNHIDVVYCNFIYTLPYIKNFNGKIIVDNHNVDNEIFSRKVEYYKSKNNYFGFILSKLALNNVQIFENAIYPHTDCVVTVCESDANSIKKLTNAENTKVIIIPNGVNVNKYAEKKYYPINNEEIILGFLGSLNLELNQSAAMLLLKEIYPRIQKKFPKIIIKVIIIGKEPPKLMYDYLARNRLENVVVTGMVDNVSTYLQQVDILVLPLMSGGGSKLRVFEALSSGVSIVGSRLAFIGIDNLLPNLVMSANTIDEYVDKISELVSNKELRLWMGKTGREFVEKNYDWKSISEKLSKEIEDTISKGEL